MRAVFDRISSAAGEGDEIGGQNSHFAPIDAASAPSAFTSTSRAFETVRDYRENYLPAGYYDLEASSTTSEHTDLPTVRSSSPENWETELNLEYLPELDSDASNALTDGERISYSHPHNENFSFSPVAESLGTEDTGTMVIDPPAEFADRSSRDIEKDSGGQILSTNRE